MNAAQSSEMTGLVASLALLLQAGHAPLQSCTACPTEGPFTEYARLALVQRVKPRAATPQGSTVRSPEQTGEW